MLTKIAIESDFGRVRIRIDGIVHLSLKQSSDIQIQSWLNPHRSYYAIEYYSAGQSILCEYGKKEIWEEILKKLEEAKII